jgi:phosphoglycerate dehydrogenase-like enzyme
MKIVLAGQFDSAVFDALGQSHALASFDHHITDPTALTDADILVIRGHVRVDAAFLAQAPRLRLIVKAGSGTDNIDKAATAARGVEVANTPASTTAVAELAILLLFAVRRRLVALDAAVHAGDWAAKFRHVGNELTGSTLGLLGFGPIARDTARLATGIGMRVMAYDRSPDRPEKQAAVRRLGVALVPLDDLLPAVGALSLHLPLTSESKGLLGAKDLKRMRPGAVIVNTARAEIVDRAALMDALANGPLAGAGLDVHYQEPVPPGDPLLALPNVVATPHIGAQTWEAHRGIGAAIVAAVERFAERAA